MSRNVIELLRRAPVYRVLDEGDRAHLAEVADVRLYESGDAIFREGDAPRHFYTIVRGRVKIFKLTPTGKDVILEIFGAGDPFGAVAVFKERPFPATAEALEDTVCIVIPRNDFFRLLERHPSLVRGLLLGLTQRLVELTNRIAELAGGRVEPRFARLFLKLARDMGREEDDGVFISMPLSRQELADLTGTTVETCIRIMSRWHREEIVATEDDGFRVLNVEALEAIGVS